MSGVQSDAIDTLSSATNCETVGNTAGNISDGIRSRHLHQALVMCEPVTEAPAVPLLTVANQMSCSASSVMQMANMSEQTKPVDTARQYASVSKVYRVFSTELANCAAESVRIGRYDNIVDFHQDYYADPVSQV